MQDKYIAFPCTKDEDLVGFAGVLWVPFIKTIDDCRIIADEYLEEKGISEYKVITDKFVEHPPGTIYSFYSMRFTH